MLSLYKFFSQRPFAMKIFFLGKVTPESHAKISESKLDVVFFESERPPENFLARMRWYAEATRFQLQKWMNRGKSKTDDQETNVDSGMPTPLTLGDYRWPWALEQFRQVIENFRPNVFTQYVTMAYLLESLSPRERERIHCVLDTHDILHDAGCNLERQDTFTGLISVKRKKLTFGNVLTRC
ncbi:MAG: hypothetical protein R3C03_14030 [Pirellulaceae bacterium]